ncbi:MAG: prepilin peptidase [Candidatus Levybacteria bacterium]|nr:prepilin peptidase [Candidatus Levybacteria bacterium]
MEFIFIFVIGVFVGSFLNVLADRLPRNESPIKGRSHCEKCKKTLKWFDLIPLLSFILLKGKCRYCHTRLSPYYLIVELTTGILFAFTAFFVLNGSQFLISNFKFLINFQFLNFQMLASLTYYLFIMSCLIVIFFADLKYGIIPDKIVFPAIFVSFLYLILNTNYLILPNLFSAVGACLFFLLLFLGTKGRGMGFGDVKFAFLMGLILGFPGIVISLYVAFLTGAIAGCILILWRKKRIFGTAIPFGPFLVIGTLVSIFFGNLIVQNFLKLVSL